MNANNLCSSLLAKLMMTFLVVSFLISPLSVVFAQEATPVDSSTSAPVVDTPSTPTDNPVVQDNTNNDAVQNPDVLPATDSTIVDNTALLPDLTVPTPEIDEAALLTDSEKTNKKKETQTMNLVRQEQEISSISRSTVKQLLPDTDQSSGSLIYNYPITIPPGRNGLQPDLKLTYNNQASEDGAVFGTGWSANIPIIERINRKGSEQIYSQNYFNSSLSGELVLVSGSTWVPKVDNGNFLKYTFSSNTWTVKDKSGTTYTFGSATGTRQDDPNDSTRIYKWMLEEIRDTNDNYIKYEYYKDGGQVYPSRIVYTGNGTTDGVFEISFLRQSRTDSVTLNKPQFSVTSNYRIYEIDIKVNSVLQHKYAFAYSNGANGSRSTLTSITESGVDDSSVTTTMPATTLTYQGQTPGWTSDSNWGSPSTFTYGTSNGQATQMADVNGDGLVDVLFSGFEWNTGCNCFAAASHVWLNNGNGWTLNSSWTIPELFMDNSYNDLGTRVADVNGDGLADIISTKYVYVTDSGGSHWDPVNKVYINNGTGWTYDSSWTLPIPIMGWGGQEIEDGTRIFDVNGDGLPDIVHAPYTGSTAVYLNTGTGWSLDTNWVMPARFMLNTTQQQGTDMADVNGDGLIDVLFSSYEWDTGCNCFAAASHVWLNNGNGWTLDTSWSIPEMFVFGSSSYSDAGTRLSDVNGDGLVDILFSGYEWDTQSNSYVWHNRVRINNGSSWVLDTGWSIPLPFINGAGYSFNDHGVRIVDVNGDGIVDIVYAPWNVTPVTYLGNTHKIDSLTQITHPQSGSSTITYKPSTQYTSSGTLLNPNSPMILETVSQISTADGLGNTSTSQYVYAGGKFYFTGPFDRKFSGFNKTTTTNTAGNVNITFYHQGDSTDTSNGEYGDQRSKIGKIYRVEQYDSSGNLYKVTVNKWDNYNIGTNHDFVKLIRATNLTYDGTSNHRDTAQEYAYDNTYGNLTLKTDWGEVTGSTDGSFTDTGSDKSVESISYVTNTGNYVVGLSYDDTTVDQSSVKVNQTRTYYDGNSLGTVGLGNITKTEKWVTGTTYVNTQKSYDGTYGLVATSTDPESNVTSYAYDSYNLYPITVTDALTNATAYTYDYSSGQIKQKTDQNGFVYQNIYDGLDRVVEQKIPGISTPFTPVIKTTYAYVDTSGSVSIHKVDYLDDSITSDTYSYFDGLGRLIQKRKEAEISGNFNISDIIYNNTGLVQKESLPYVGSGSSKTSPTTTAYLFNTYTYDPLNRVSTKVDAAGTTSYAYNLWKTSITDPRGKVKDLYNDTRGNLTQVDEHNSSSTYTTAYTYNLNGKLLNITDALSNVRNFTYDGLGNRLTAEDLHAGGDGTYGSWSYTYDNAGNMTQSVSPNSKTINYTYDALNRKLTENYTGATGTEITYSYDSCTNGITKLCSVTMTSGSDTSYTYDSKGNITSEAKVINSNTYTTSYTYDRQGNQLIITYPDSAQTRYTYNTAGLLNQIERKESGGSYTNVVSNIDYSPIDQVTTVVYANGITTTNTYDVSNLYRLSNKTSGAGTPPSNDNPVIALSGASLVNLNVGDTWTELGYSATDTEDGTLTSSVTTTGSVNTAVAGTYQLVYAVVDSQGAPAARMIRTVVVHTVSSPSLLVKALVVAGGGGGGVSYGGGGAGGGYQYNASFGVTTQSYSVTVGAGGAAQANGSNSVFSTITATGGGKGGDIVQNGSNGGSGGGGGLISNGGTGSQGSNGGNGGNNGGGGGGGATSAGSNFSGTTGGSGGNGTSNSITGSSVIYTGGGGGGAHSSSGTGGSAGSGGGGLGGGANHSATNGTANTGGGGGGGSNMTADVGAGGSGVVIISYVTADLSGYIVTGGTATTNGSNTVRTFTSNGTFAISLPTNNNPVIALSGASLVNLNVGDTWTELGYSATDTEDGTLTSSVTTTGSVNTAVAGTYQLVYAVVDSQGAPAARMIRTVVVHTVSAGNLQNISYTYDVNGNITQISDSSNTSSSKNVTYTYDDLNRMTQAAATNVASGQSTYTQNFTYNAIGNITAGPVGSYTYAGTGYANPHAATSINSITNTYDHDGNVLTDGTLTNTWNYKDQLATSTDGTFTRDYLYDQGGSRVSSTDGTTTTEYPNKYYNYDGAKKTKSIYVGDQLVATVETVGAVVTPYYDHTDHLNSVAVVTDGSGAQTELLDYFPYGAQRISSGSYSSQRRALGQMYDSDTTLNYYQARYMNSLQGRFISEDPMFWSLPDSYLFDPQQQNSGRTMGGLNSVSAFGWRKNMQSRAGSMSGWAEFLADPQMQNSYSYGRNNPLRYSDPTGLWGISVTTGGNAEFGPVIGGAAFSGSTGVAVSADGFKNFQAGIISNTSNYASVPTVQQVAEQKQYTGVFGGSLGLNYGLTLTNGKSLDSFQNSGQSLNINIGIIGFQYSKNDKGVWTAGVNVGLGKGFSMSSYPSTTLINGKSTKEKQ